MIRIIKRDSDGGIVHIGKSEAKPGESVVVIPHSDVPYEFYDNPKLFHIKESAIAKGVSDVITDSHTNLLLHQVGLNYQLMQEAIKDWWITGPKGNISNAEKAIKASRNRAYHWAACDANFISGLVGNLTTEGKESLVSNTRELINKGHAYEWFLLINKDKLRIDNWAELPLDAGSEIHCDGRDAEGELRIIDGYVNLVGGYIQNKFNPFDPR